MCVLTHADVECASIKFFSKFISGLYFWLVTKWDVSWWGFALQLVVKLPPKNTHFCPSIHHSFDDGLFQSNCTGSLLASWDTAPWTWCTGSLSELSSGCLDSVFVSSLGNLCHPGLLCTGVSIPSFGISGSSSKKSSSEGCLCKCT